MTSRHPEERPIMTTMEFQRDADAPHAHAALQSAIATLDHAEHCAVLWFADIMQRRLYRELGYSSMNQYAAAALGFSRTRTGDFIRLAGKLPPEEVYKVVKDHDRGRHIVIHTMGFIGAPRKMMETLAKMTGGRYSDIPSQ